MAPVTPIMRQALPPPKQTRAAGIALALFWSFCLLQVLFGYYFSGQAGFSVGNDDAFISYRYAQNLIEHGVLSFNPQDAPLVEGFSNPTLVALASLIYPISGPNGLYWVMAGLGAGATGLAIALLSRSLTEGDTPELAIPIMFALALCPPLWIHGTSGLETAWVFLFQVLIWRSCLRLTSSGPSDGLGLLLLASMALVLTRTDGFLFPLLAALWLSLQGQTRAARLVILVSGALFAGQVVLRLFVYGLPLPLPSYVKVSGTLVDRLEIALRYLASIAIKNGLALPFTGLLLAAVFWARTSFISNRLGAFRTPPFALWAGGGLIAYYCVIGGDIYRDRFLILVFPLGTVLLLQILLTHFGRRAMVGATLGVIGWQVLGGFIADPRLAYRIEPPKYDRWITLGRFLNTHHPGALLATGAAGKLPFFSRLETIDMLGLNTRQIAFTDARGANPGHNKFDPDYIFSRQPDIICAHTFGTGSMAWGLDRARYLAEGYQMAYLVRRRDRTGQKILDIRNASDEEIAALITEGYTYGCALRS